MLEVFENIKTRRVIATDTIGNFPPLESFKALWKLWKKLSSGLNCRLLRIWSFMYCSVIILLLAFNFYTRKKQRSNIRLRVANDIVPSQVRVYHERFFADNIVCKFWFVRSFSCQQYSKVITNKTSENVSQIRTKECKTRSFICKVTLNFLRSWRKFNRDTVFAVIMSFLIESVHGFNNICKGRVKAGFQIKKLWQLTVSKNVKSKNMNFPSLTFLYTDG